MLPRYGESIPYDRALELNRGNPDDKWRGRKAANRLEPEAWPNVAPKFQLKNGQRIFTIGSCFARNIEEYLHQLGFDIPALRMVAPDEAGGGRSNAILNRYTPVAIAQDIEWTHGILGRDGVVGWKDVEPLVFEVAPGRFQDMHLNTDIAVSKERVLERRAELFAINKDGFESDVVVITPGVIEAWYDQATKLFVQRTPSPRLARQMGAGRIHYKVLTYEECYACLNRAIDLLDRHRRKWFLFTVSPVPLTRTFTNQDIVIANQYSKSLLRAVVGRICSERDNCDYFPSYESVMLTKQPYVWNDDLIHVTDRFVSKIVGRLVGGRMEGGGPQAARSPIMDLLERFTDCLQREDQAAAMAIYREIGERGRDVEVPQFHRQATLLLQAAGDLPGALMHAKRFVELRPGTLGPLIILARVQFQAGDKGLAHDTATRALALARKETHKNMVKQLIKRFSRPAPVPSKPPANSR